MNQAHYETAIFAGGCFWCMQPVFDNLPGVTRTEVGYTGGNSASPTYEEISTGATGHLEAVKVTFNPAKISYRTLLDEFWRSIDPTDPDGQFADRGSQYRTAIFYASPDQQKAAEEAKNVVEKSKKFTRKIATSILPALAFYPAEGYHQGYYLKNPTNYNAYKIGSGRAAFLAKEWGRSCGAVKPRSDNE